MYLAVSDHLSKLPVDPKELPGYAELLTKFNANLQAFRELLRKQEISWRGVSEEKHLRREELTARAVDLGDRFSAYLAMTGDTVLALEVGYKETRIRRATDIALAERSRALCDKSKERAAELLPYGVTPEMLDGLESAIEAFVATIPKKRSAVSQSKNVTGKVEELIQGTNQLLLSMDAVIRLLRRSHPDYWFVYRNNRKVLRRARRQEVAVPAAAVA